MEDNNVNRGEAPPATPVPSGLMEQQPLKAQSQTLLKTMDDMAKENYWLREKLKEMTSDRDRLLCEVANLRLELDMMELKRLPDDNFPQKASDRESPAATVTTVANTNTYNSPNNSTLISTTGPPGTGAGYIYLPQQPHYSPSQQQQLCYQNLNNSSANFINGGHHMQQQSSLLYSTSGMGNGAPFYHQPSHLHHHGSVIVPNMQYSKKGTIRNNGDVLKRTRSQNAYELSQDLLEKQIELLERKYGGIRARNAAITIQRAFRHYTMVKRFASITAMAKAEKRMSRRVLMQPTVAPIGGAANTKEYYQTTYMDEHGQVITSTYHDQDMTANNSHQYYQQQQPRVIATISAQQAPGGGNSQQQQSQVGQQCRMTPVRSMSLRERRSLDGSPIVARSQSGTTSPMPQQQGPIMVTATPTAANTSTTTTASSATPPHSHPHVNVLHQEQNYYSTPGQYMQQYDSGQLHSMNNSWNNSHQSGSPHNAYYSAQQIYSRPRLGMTTPPHAQQQMASVPLAIVQAKRTPPEVPKRTSSIITNSNSNLCNRSLGGSRSNGLCKTADNGSLSSVQSSGSDSSGAADRLARDLNIMDISNTSDRSNSPQWKQRGNNKPYHHQHPSQQQQQQLALNQQLIIQSPDHQILHQNHHLINNNPITIVDQLDATGNPQQSHLISSHTSAAQYSLEQNEHLLTSATQVVMPTTKISETIRKRQYRVGLNLFNKKPEKGIAYLIKRGFLEQTAQGVARFLISRKGLSRQMIGEYLGNLQLPFNMAVLECFSTELDLCGMQVDVALRKFQAYFRMPGEAQKIERLMEVFSQRYCQCNSDIVARLRSTDTVFVLAFAIIMLNTDLHTPNLKPERRMRIEDFVKNLRGIDDCHDIDTDMLVGIYERVKANEFKPGSDHVTQVMKVQATIVGKKPNLALPHRRLVCYCRLYEIPDIYKKERAGVHQREVFLFNDLLVITKILSKKKTSVTYTFRNSYPLCGMVVTLLDAPNYTYCIRLSQKVDGKVLVTFNARNEHDRCKFAEDLRESISEMDEMEQLRIESELERQKTVRARNTTANNGGNTNGNAENRDSGVADIEVGAYHQTSSSASSPNNNTANMILSNGHASVGHAGLIMDNGALMLSGDHYQQYQQNMENNNQMLKRSALSNSLLDMHEFGSDKPQRRGSVGSLDSGMSISFQSTSVASSSGGSRNDSQKLRQQQQQQQQQLLMIQQQQQQQALSQQPQTIFGGVFNKRGERKLSRSEDCGPGLVNNGGAAATMTAGVVGPEAAVGRSTEV